MSFSYPYSHERLHISGESTWYASVIGAGQTELPNKITKVTPDAAARALAIGFKKVAGKKPSAAILALLLGQWALETGNGSAVHNYNFGNTKRSSSDTYYQFFRCSEILNGKEVFFDPPAPECAFSAYKAPEDGAEAYVKILKKRPHWWNGLLSGNVATFNAGLTTAPKYYTANPAQYLKTLQNRVAAYMPQAKQYGATFLTALGTALLGIGMGGMVLYYAPKVYRSKAFKKTFPASPLRLLP
jgi:hypothetical protein